MAGNLQRSSDVVDDVMLARLRTVLAVGVSSAAHLAVVLAAARGASAAHPPADAHPPAADSWIGETFEVGLTAATTGGDPTQPNSGPTGESVAAPEPAATQDPAAQLEPALAKPPALRASPVAASTPAAATASSQTEHTPRPKKVANPTPGGSASASADKTLGNGPGPFNSAGPGSFGMQGQGHNAPRDLSRAFTRAVPVAVSADPVWATLALGPAGTFDLKLVLGEDGRIVSATPEGHVADHFRVVASRTVAMLGAGTFAIKAEPGAGVQVLRISASVSTLDSAPVEDRSAAGAYGLGFEPPWNGKPGKAHFTLRSGRHIEITVRVLRSD